MRDEAIPELAPGGACHHRLQWRSGGLVCRYCGQVWQAGEVSVGDLSRHFSKSEFACQCGCGATDPAPALVTALETLREAYGQPLVITSGLRCFDHNLKVGGVPHSAHVTGEAADVAVGNGYDRWRLVELAFAAGFRRLGIARTFVHLEMAPPNIRSALWTYQ